MTGWSRLPVVSPLTLALAAGLGAPPPATASHCDRIPRTAPERARCEATPHPSRTAAPIRLDAPEIKESGRMIALGRPQGEIQARWRGFVEKTAAGGGAIDPNALVQAVLKASYQQQQEDRKPYADKVKRFNEMKKTLGAELERERQGQARPVGPARSRARAKIDELERRLQSVGDDAQLATLDLQNALQKQQQTMQMLSNISKMLHDTAQAVIRNIKG
jgi:hypothetical protein